MKFAAKCIEVIVVGRVDQANMLVFFLDTDSITSKQFTNYLTIATEPGMIDFWCADDNFDNTVPGYNDGPIT